MPNTPKTKPEFVRRYKAGEFGNRPRTWETLEEFVYWYRNQPVTTDTLESGFVESSVLRPLIHLRNKRAGGSTHYNLTPDSAYAAWVHEQDETQWYASEMAPHHCNVIQGEVTLEQCGLFLTYNTERDITMREAMTRPSYATGLKARALLQRLCLRGQEWLWHLLESYDRSVVEFSSFSTQYGIEDMRTVFWEVRPYENPWTPERAIYY